MTLTVTYAANTNQTSINKNEDGAAMALSCCLPLKEELVMESVKYVLDSFLRRMSNHESERPNLLSKKCIEKGQFEGPVILALLSTSHEWTTWEDTVFVARRMILCQLLRGLHCH